MPTPGPLIPRSSPQPSLLRQKSASPSSSPSFPESLSKPGSPTGAANHATPSSGKETLACIAEEPEMELHLLPASAIGPPPARVTFAKLSRPVHGPQRSRPQTLKCFGCSTYLNQDDLYVRHSACMRCFVKKVNRLADKEDWSPEEAQAYIKVAAWGVQ